MKKKNVLALALAAGLVFGGTAYAAEETAPDASDIPMYTSTADDGIGETGMDEETNLDNTQPTPEPAQPAQPAQPEKPEKPKEENNENGYS